ncbi:MAG: hypothetical protein ACWGNV_12510 [Bacteroidales bacterium]
MKIRQLVILFTLMVMATGLNAQGQRFMIKITDTQNQSTLLENATSSSSSSCNSSDFPVMQEGTRTDVNFRDLNKILVHPERSTQNDEMYVAVELIHRDGSSEMTEMIRSVRMMGNSDQGRYGKRIDEIREVDVIF